MKSNKLLASAILILAFSGIGLAINHVFAQSNDTNSTNTNATSTTNATATTNATSTNNATATTNATSTGNATTTTNATSINNATATTNATSTGNATAVANSTSTINATATTNATSATNSTSGNYTNSPSNANETNAVQPLIIIPSNMTTQINNTAGSVVPYDMGTIHSAVAAEVNIQNQNVKTTSMDNSVSVDTSNSTSDSVEINVSAPDQTGPKVILINLSNTTINVGNLEYLGIMYDGKPIAPAANVDAILHAKSTDNPNFAIIVTQTGAQILVLVPHFSTHTITLTNLEKIVASPVPEFPWALLTLMIAIVPIIAISRKTSLFP